MKKKKLIDSFLNHNITEMSNDKEILKLFQSVKSINQKIKQIGV